MSYNLGKAKTERSCALSWFSNWTPEQKSVFLQRLSEKSSLDAATESLLNELEGMNLGEGNKECPSVFQCQLRIFDQWFRRWSEEDKEEFSRMLMEEADPQK